MEPNITIDNKNVVIFHTHSCESYTPSEKFQYNTTGTYRTTDLNYTVTRVGTELETELKEANEKHVFGTKMRSVIYEPNAEGIKAIVAQQFEFAKTICDAGLVPIIEPEVDINAPEKEKCEEILKDEIKKQLDNWNKEDKIMFKFTIPTVANHYLDLYDYECVVRIVALSGGYDIDKAVELLTKNNRMIASFSRALLQDLNANQTQEEFDTKLNDVIVKIYNASIS